MVSFPGGTSGKESACQYRRHKRCGWDLWVRKIPWRSKWQPLQYPCLENSRDRGAQWATVHRIAKSRTWLKQLSRQVVGRWLFWLQRRRDHRIQSSRRSAQPTSFATHLPENTLFSLGLLSSHAFYRNWLPTKRQRICHLSQWESTVGILGRQVCFVRGTLRPTASLAPLASWL